MSAHAFPETIGYRKFRLTHRAVNAPVVPIKSVDAQAGKGRLLLRSLVTLPVTILLLASASNTGTAARVCIGGHFHYGGSGLHHDRVHAQASAVRAWRAIQAESHGARAAANSIRPVVRFIANMPVATRVGVVSSVVVRAIPSKKAMMSVIGPDG